MGFCSLQKTTLSNTEVTLFQIPQEGDGPIDQRWQGLCQIGMWCSMTLITSMAASKRTWRSCDLRFEISNLYYPGIHVHVAADGLRGHGGLKTTSEVIWSQIWNKKPWLPWYLCAYCLWRPPRPWRPPNDLWGHMTSDLKSATLITGIHVHIASNSLQGHGALQKTSEVRSDCKIQVSDLNYICYHAFLASNGLYGLNKTGTTTTTTLIAIHWSVVAHHTFFQDICHRNWTSIPSAGYNRDRSGLYVERIWANSNGAFLSWKSWKNGTNVDWGSRLL